jgi:hypoxanthine phosphoribosyltransferase
MCVWLTNIIWLTVAAQLRILTEIPHSRCYVIKYLSVYCSTDSLANDRLMGEMTNKDIKILLTETEITIRVNELAVEIAKSIDDDWLVVALLRGSFIFAADLVRALHKNGVNPRIDFMTGSSYGDNQYSNRQVEVNYDTKAEVKDQKILLIDDIFDTGHTMKATVELMQQRRVSELKTAVLLEKPSRHEVDLVIDYVGFEIENHFVVGYGLDSANRYRTLPYIGYVVYGIS